MTENKANEIFRTKYPNGKIFKRNSMGGTSSSTLAVIFNPNGKVYSYQSSSYAQLLSRFGFTVLYKHNVENINHRINEIEKLLKDGGEVDFFTNEFIKFTDCKFDELNEELEDLIHTLKIAIYD